MSVLVDVNEIPKRVLKWQVTRGNRFSSKQRSRKQSTAWEKTFAKWYLNAAGYMCGSAIDSCGLCNLYHDYGMTDCVGCPIYLETGDKYCYRSPLERVSYDPTNAWFILEEILFLIRVYNKVEKLMKERRK